MLTRNIKGKEGGGSVREKGTEIRVMEENGGKSKWEAGPAGKYDKKTTCLSS